MSDQPDLAKKVADLERRIKKLEDAERDKRLRRSLDR